MINMKLTMWLMKFSARSVGDVQTAIERIFPLVYEFRKERTPADEEIWQAKRAKRKTSHDIHNLGSHQDSYMELVTLSDDEQGSDQSWD